jgi:hypothetical protein
VTRRVARLYYTEELLLVAGSKSDAIEASAPEENDKDDREGDQDAGEAPGEDVPSTVTGDCLSRLGRSLPDLKVGRIA